MRINRFIAQAVGCSRRRADELIATGKIKVNDRTAKIGQTIEVDDKVLYDGKLLAVQARQLILLNKPTGFVCSRRGQGSETIYELVPKQLQHLKTVGRLDKDSSGLLILTNDGQLANQLSHPSHRKIKIYEVEIDKNIAPEDIQKLLSGVNLDDGLSKFDKISGNKLKLLVHISQGRNRQIRRTFKKLGYEVVVLNRIQLGPYKLGALKLGQYKHL